MGDLLHTVGGGQSQSNHVDADKAAKQNSGVLNNQTVTQHVNTRSLIESASEELTMKMSETAEKEFGKRELKSGHAKNKMVEQVEFYLKQVAGREKQQKLAQFVKELQQQKNSNARQILDWVKNFSNDPSDQFAALEALEKTLKNKGDEVTAQTIRKAKENLLAAEESAVKAGINVVDVGAAFEKAENPLGTAESLRSFYRDSVLDYGGFVDTYKRIYSEYGKEKFESAVDFLLKGLSADMSSNGPSMSKEKLQAVVTDLTTVRLLKGMHERCDRVIGRIQSAELNLPQKDGLELMNATVSLLGQQWLSEDRVRDYARPFCGTNKTAEVLFTQELKEMFRELPEHKVFNDLDARMQIIQTIQDALDVAIYEEEDEYDGS
ncbi:type III secretion system gatekeeper subunit SctW [Algicola sagamiensis]|uniref:type III secretion system gatekeeper subunit SctW n=1 Tax=Algicola sagamiensis TaxID=163869 RepID=UPI00038167BF|nr:type III secretion system gatekeeper subunit SctW [Algicola sagamiensis]